ncbi:hypothetical protein O1611_g9964 [Lasiodiplodia mahajangana]|uniref:Uncharacterized protein n=1 Tax=Lasiodiplodia mahajangana TaxID=1108764 RepID=A0ACC2J3J3_9PEZI|nr:hypothetical protein O1611_g9964 [Lasiodiplodia mahajangana]
MLLDGPSLAPPGDALPAFDNPPNGNAISFATIGLCLGLSTLFLSLRAYATFACLKKAYLSDYVMIVGYLIYVAWLGILLSECLYIGFFVHMWDIRLRDLPHLLYVGTSLFAVNIALIKAAILLEWLRIFVPKGTRNTFFWVAHALLLVNVLINVVGLFVINLTCIPHEKIWNRLTVRGHCLEGHAIDVTSASINLTIDLLILLLPQRVIWSLKISTSKKIGVAAVFSLGLLGFIASIFRLVETIHYSFSPDSTYYFSAVGLWTVAEATCGILVFSVPAAPKALAGLVSLTSTMTSWISNSESSGDGRPFPPRSSTNKRLRPTAYKELDDTQLITMDTLGPEHGQSRSRISLQDSIREDDIQTSILRTTHITTKSELVAGVDSTKDYLNRQHPWDPPPHQRIKPQVPMFGGDH